MNKEAVQRALGKIRSAKDCPFAAIDTLLFEAEKILEEALAEQPVEQPAQRRPLTSKQRLKVQKSAAAAMDANPNLSWRETLITETEAAHNIKEQP